MKWYDYILVSVIGAVVLFLLLTVFKVLTIVISVGLTLLLVAYVCYLLYLVNKKIKKRI